MPAPFSFLKRIVRGLVGTDALDRRGREHDLRVRRDALLLGNALATARLDRASLERVSDYRRVAEVGGMLRTWAVEGIDLVRIGGDLDGGYVMLDTLRPPAEIGRAHV